MFTDKSLGIFTRVLVIYAAFFILVVVAKSISDPVSDNSLAPANGYLPSYVIAGVHFVLLMINGAMIVLKRYNWLIPSISAIIMLLCRIYFQDLSLWIWSW
ncbi:hypothetical protein [Nonlabens ponticola]|uniref:DoxX family protein n=1 Tax=Nonlabens ponticola TaxID=2496866 RepID=A0A3S9MXT1_9FLAO|nr:hypothetical protein [Nonlabens ponticola]AZQ43853.1 hypothetical protein EJ995_06280 [Nonlabens ponticola]